MILKNKFDFKNFKGDQPILYIHPGIKYCISVVKQHFEKNKFAFQKFYLPENHPLALRNTSSDTIYDAVAFPAAKRLFKR